jgi:hypothetical protein
VALGGAPGLTLAEDGTPAGEGTVVATPGARVVLGEGSGVAAEDSDVPDERGEAVVPEHAAVAATTIARAVSRTMFDATGRAPAFIRTVP